MGGTVYVYGFSVRVLMDSGASHSFIASCFASCLDVSPDCMPYVLDVSTPTRGSMSTDSVYRGCEISMAGVTVYTDLIVLPIHDLMSSWVWTGYQITVHAWTVITRLWIFAYHMELLYSSREAKGSRRQLYLLFEYRGIWKKGVKGFSRTWLT
ncbi:RVP_2 domain-containing protein [Cephalotus follicularis]|uniref:RVP_2 domain-containing protein n=1 Tax=Cephalotus follicularis TaxID=3775 RepID=A0A1Q3BPS0_CEPFO|nr:RVP_2 domain-containing protein [Cephalotus follicularis]